MYRFVGIRFAEEKKLWSISLQIVAYMCMLICEIVKANIQMIKIVLSPSMKISPIIVYFQPPVRTDFAKIMLMYSIMLTPGTVIFELVGGRFGIHAIDPDVIIGGAGDGIFAPFVQRLQKMEGGH